jgi:hypothetical protein
MTVVTAAVVTLAEWYFGGNSLVLEKAHTLLIDINKAIPGIRRSEHQPLKRQLFKSAFCRLTQTLLRVAPSTASANFFVFSRLLSLLRENCSNS